MGHRVHDVVRRLSRAPRISFLPSRAPYTDSISSASGGACVEISLYGNPLANAMLIHTHNILPCYNTRIAICQGVRNAPVLSCAAHPCTKWGNGDATRGAADERCAVRLPGACARSDTGRLPVLVSALPPGSVEECAAPSVAGRVMASARLTDRAFSGAFWSRTPYVEHQEAQFPPFSRAREEGGRGISQG